jgi:hypothetical protein
VLSPSQQDALFDHPSEYTAEMREALGLAPSAVRSSSSSSSCKCCDLV